MGDNNKLFLHLNGELHRVGEDVTPESTLNDFLRANKGLTGTKVMCREGGCGACVVAVTRKHPVTKEEVTMAVNSCLVSTFSCSGWKISTVEGIGTPTDPHPVQKTIVTFNGTQCGFCTPGMVMSMYALYEKQNFTMQEVENSLGGNICRCTGYRPILAAFKSMSVDYDEELNGKLMDIEEIPKCFSETCKSSCEIPCSARKSGLLYNYGAKRWYKAFSIREIFQIFNMNVKLESYRLVAGNTAKGVYNELGTADNNIDISDVVELRTYSLNTNDLRIGANMTLTETIELFKKISTNDPNFTYLLKAAEHLELVAHVPVRNLGTLAGNLMIKHEHNEFASDVFLLLETLGATLIIVDYKELRTKLKPADFLSFNMNKKFIEQIVLRPLNNSYYFESFKIMSRAQNAHAIVNAGFLLQISGDRVQSAKIVYGGINPTFIHARKAEQFLTGKNVFENHTLQDVFKILDGEIQPNYVLPEPSPEFRKQLAIALFYKFILGIYPKVSAVYKSGGLKLYRPISNGTQDFETNKSMYPLTQPVRKREATSQATGKSKYIMDMPDAADQLYGAFVLAEAPASSKILKIDSSQALKLKGIAAFIDHKDIPGENNFSPSELGLPTTEEIFCSGTIQFYHQPIGLVVANSQKLAEEGASLIHVTYKNPTENPIITIKNILKKNSKDKIVHVQTILPKKCNDSYQAPETVIKGEFDSGWQYHYHMETQCCNVVPIENEEFDVFPSSQWLAAIKSAGAHCLGIQASKINVRVSKLGGGFGAKISRNTLIACAALIAAAKLQQPVKVWMPFSTNIKTIGKRTPTFADYNVEVNEKGVIKGLEMKCYTDNGVANTDSPTSQLIDAFVNSYDSSTYTIDIFRTITDTPANGWARAPGTMHGHAILESIMEHIAYELKVDPLEVRLANVDKKQHPLLEGLVRKLVKWADVEKRKGKVIEFNKQNRWRKRGISVIPMAFGLQFVLANFGVIVSIYVADGSVAISHGGVEMGQGINTKAIQVVAHIFGIAMEMVSVKPTDELTTPNSYLTGSSITSEAVCLALVKACNILLKRMEPVKKSLSHPTWLKTVRECYDKQVDLCATYMYKTGDLDNYYVYGVAATEVELDILTGNHNVLRVDILEDCGESLSPFIDIGQVEGAYVMGMGYWTSEKLVYDENGELMTYSTWNYKPPSSKDIPIDFRVKFPKKSPNVLSPFKTKSTGEPPLCLAFGVPLAIRQAAKWARLDADPSASMWYPINGPSTVEDNFMNCLNNYHQYTL